MLPVVPKARLIPLRMWGLSVTHRTKSSLRWLLLDIEKEYGGTESGKRPGVAMGLTSLRLCSHALFKFSATLPCQLVWLGASWRRSWTRRKAKSIHYLSSRTTKTWGSTRCSNTSRARVLASETLHFQDPWQFRQWTFWFHMFGGCLCVLFRGVTCNVIKAKPFPTEVVTKAKLPPRSRGWGCCQRMLHQSVQTRGVLGRMCQQVLLLQIQVHQGKLPAWPWRAWSITWLCWDQRARNTPTNQRKRNRVKVMIQVRVRPVPRMMKQAMEKMNPARAKEPPRRRKGRERNLEHQNSLLPRCHAAHFPLLRSNFNLTSCLTGKGQARLAAQIAEADPRVAHWDYQLPSQATWPDIACRCLSFSRLARNMSPIFVLGVEPWPGRPGMPRKNCMSFLETRWGSLKLLNQVVHHQFSWGDKEMKKMLKEKNTWALELASTPGPGSGHQELGISSFQLSTMFLPTRMEEMAADGKPNSDIDAFYGASETRSRPTWLIFLSLVSHLSLAAPTMIWFAWEKNIDSLWLGQELEDHVESARGAARTLKSRHKLRDHMIFAKWYLQLSQHHFLAHFEPFFPTQLLRFGFWKVRRSETTRLQRQGCPQRKRRTRSKLTSEHVCVE